MKARAWSRVTSNGKNTKTTEKTTKHGDIGPRAKWAIPDTTGAHAEPWRSRHTRSTRDPTRPAIIGLWGWDSTRKVCHESSAPKHSARMALPHSSQRGIKWDAPSGGSGFESRRRPPSAPLDGARSTRRVPGGRTPKYPLRPWVHTRGGNHQSVPGRKVEVGGSYARPTPRTYVGGTICRGGGEATPW